jgi:hypothetical protein
MRSTRVSFRMPSELIAEIERIIARWKREIGGSYTMTQLAEEGIRLKLAELRVRLDEAGALNTEAARPAGKSETEIPF